VHCLGGLGKCCVGANFAFTRRAKGWYGDLVRGVWVVKMVWGIGGWCMVCIGKVVENGVVVVCEKTNGWCELRHLMRHDKLKDMGLCFPIKKEVY
jgi:hypothetical protein